MINENKRSFWRTISLTLILCLVITSIPAMTFATEEDGVPETEAPQGPVKELEDVTMEDVIEDESSEYVTAFDLGGNQRAKVFTSYPVRYEDENGELAEVEPELVGVDESKSTEQGASLSGYAYENKAGAYKQYIPKNLSENTPVLMEHDKYSISMTPTGWLNGMLNKNKKAGKKKEEVIDLVGKKEQQDITAVYDSTTGEAAIEYTSLADGLKECIILNEAPKKNELSYKLTLKGLTAKVNENDEGVTFFDKDSGEIVASLDAPFMNDATGEAYSTDIKTSLKQRGNSGQYTLTFTVDEAYLQAEARKYPVTIDPTATWTGSSKIYDAYIISSSPTYNYYTSETKIMPSGRGSSGSKYRTCINYQSLRAEMLHNNITSAYFDIYETGNSSSGKVVRVYKILENWKPSQVTWNTCPDFGTATSYLAAKNSTGTANKRMRFDVTDWVSKVAGGSSNFGLMLKNQVEASTSYTEFYGSRTGATSYRPKLTVTYTADEPTLATSVKADKAAYYPGESITVTWAGITANSLDHIEYRVAKYDDAGNVTNETYVPYTRLTSGKSSGTAVIPGSSSFPEGRYSVFIRGVSTNGVKGTGRRCGILTITKDKPTVATLVEPTERVNAAGSLITMEWEGITASNLSAIQYRVGAYDSEWNQTEYAYVPYTTLDVAPTSSGTAVIPGSDKFEPGNYKIFLRGVNSKGVRGVGKGAEVVVVDNEGPYIGSLQLKVNGKVMEDRAYTKIAPIEVEIDGIGDDRPIQESQMRYSLYGTKTHSYIFDQENTKLEVNNDGTYKYSFTIPSQELKSDMYFFSFRVDDDFGQYASTFSGIGFDNQAPDGSISVNDAVYGNSISTITDRAKISASVYDTHSGVDAYTLSLYHGSQAEPGAKVKDLFTINSEEKIDELDAKKFDDGPYCLRLDITDKMGNSQTVWQDITIDKPIEKPIIGVSTAGGSGELTVSWGFQNEIAELDHIQYSLDDGPWTDVTISSKIKGTFNVSLPEDMTGTHSIKVRGVEVDGTEGESSRFDYNIDTQAPTVRIDNIVRDIIMGSVDDGNLVSWKVLVKAKDASDDTYIETASGTKRVLNGRITTAGLSDSGFPAESWYTVKLEAVDDAGNTTSATFDVYKGENDLYAQVIESQHPILRSLGQNQQDSHFVVSSTEDALRMKDDSLFTSGAWFVDFAKVSAEKTYQADFSTYEEGKHYSIAAAGKDAAGALYYSRDIYVNADSVTYSLPAAENGQAEVTVPFAESIAGFTLQAEGLPAGASWYAKTAEGEYTQITPGSLTYILQLDDQKLSANALTLKAVKADGTAIENVSFTLQLAVMEGETFEVSVSESYWPENVTAQDKINYKTYVRWELPETMPEGLSYEVYRSTIENFVPGETTLVAQDVKDGYWCDINTNYSISLYYKVRAVIKDENGEIISASKYSDTVESTPVDRDEYQKTLGHKEYWAYADIATPSGSGYIEKSQGNFVYEQTDGEIANEQLAVALSRTYNSMASSKSAFGYGWTHSYDIELLRLGKDSSLDEGILVLRDGSGTLYQFKAEGDTYISSMGKYVNLKKEDKTQAIALTDLSEGEGGQVNTVSVTSAYTMTTRDNLTYYFDASGKLVWMEESNGNLLLFHYDEKRGLLDRITTGNNISVSFTYNEGTGGSDALTIHDMTLPDGQKVVYNYEGSCLTSVTRYPAGQASGGITYRYTYDNRKMTSLTDGMENTYRISYADGSGKAAQFTYPASGGASEAVRVSINAADGATLTEKLAGSTVVKQERDYFDGAGQCIRHTDYSGNEEQNTYYTYKDSLLTQETTKGRYFVLNKDGAGGSVATGEYDNTKTYKYDEAKEVIAKETDEGTAVADFTYAETGRWTEYQPSSYKEVTTDDVTTANETYQYDENGNLTRIVDQVAGTFTNYSYFTGASDSAKGALKSEAEYLISDGTCLSSTEVAIEALSGNRKKETTTTISSGNKTITEIIYDIMGRELESVTYTYTAFGTDKERISKEAKTYTYDGFGRVSGITTTTSRVNGSLAEIDGTSNTTTESKTYDANGTLISETGTDGITSSYQYDAMNRVTSTTKSGGGLSQTTRNSYSYGAVSVNEGKAEPTSYASAFITTETVDGMVSCVTYEDGLGRTVRRKRGTTVTDYSYDASGNAVTEYVKTGANEGILTLHVVDKDGNETATLQNPVWNAASGCFDVGADTICETAGYDKSGNLISQTDGNGSQTGFAYDAQGRIIGVSLQNGSDTYQTSYAYSEAGEDGAYRSYVTQTAANGAVSVETTDADGNVVAASDQGKSGDTAITNQTSYDAFGNVMEARHADGSRITYTYDAKNRVSEKTQIDKGGNAKYKTVYTYYDDDQVKETYDYKVNGSSQTLYHYVHNTYDGLKRLTAQAEVNGSSVPSDLAPYTTTYTYDLKDRLTAVSYGSACGSEVDGLAYTYSGNQLTDIHVKIGSGSYLAKSYTYDNAGRVSTVKDYYNFRANDTANYILLTYTYDAFGRVADMTYTKAGSVIEQHSYEYDKNSNIVKEHNVNTASGLDEIREFTYDDLSQLKHSVIKNRITTTTEVEGEADAEGNPTTTIKTEVSERVAKETDYTYDSVGNRTKKVENGTATSYTYNGLNQLLSESGGGASLTYAYDRNGNQTGITGTAGGSSVSKVFTYTPDNMLATYIEGTKTQENLYTGDGQRIQKKEGSEVTNYFHQEGSVLYTTDGNDSLKSFNLLNVSGAFGTARKSGTGENYYLYTEDLRGSTVNVLDNSASKVVSYWYDDFGDVSESKASSYSSFDNELQYTGAVHDASTGLLYLNARFYDPQTGRFISRDTYRGEQNDANTWHLYLYCANNPVNYVDPSGHIIETVLDVLSIGWSASEFSKKKSWTNAGYLAWDIAAACIPFLPASYTVKGVTKANKIKKIGTKVPNTLNEIRKQNYITVGKYSALKILFKGATRRSKIELHHIIEKRFHPAFKIGPNQFPAVAIGKTVHREITTKFKKAYNYNYKNEYDYYSKLTRGDLEIIVDKVYLSMPMLHKMAMLQVKRHSINKSLLAVHVKW